MTTLELLDEKESVIGQLQQTNIRQKQQRLQFPGSWYHDNHRFPGPPGPSSRPPSPPPPPSSPLPPPPLPNDEMSRYDTSGGGSGGLGETMYVIKPLQITRNQLIADRKIDFKKYRKREFRWKDIMNSDDDDEEDERRKRRRMNHYPNDNDSDDDDDQEEEERRQEKQQDIEHMLTTYSFEKVVRIREKYWIKKDISNGWCFICHYTRTTKAKERFHDFGRLYDYFIANLPTMDLEQLINSIQDIYLCRFRPFLPIRSIDPYTNQPKPPHWWGPPSIHDHFTIHESTPLIRAELSLKSLFILQQDLENNMRQVDSYTGKTIIDDKMLKQHLEIRKQITLVEKQIEQTRLGGGGGSSSSSSVRHQIT